MCQKQGPARGDGGKASVKLRYRKMAQTKHWRGGYPNIRKKGQKDAEGGPKKVNEGVEPSFREDSELYSESHVLTDIRIDRIIDVCLQENYIYTVPSRIPR